MKKKKIGFIVKGIINYLSAIALAVVFALFLSGRIGWFLVTAFICAPVISCVTAYIISRRIYIESAVSSDTFCKGERCEIELSITNDSFIPSPPVIIDMFDCPSVRCRDKKYSISMMPFSSETIAVEYKTGICGRSEIGISRIRISDFFGIMYFEPLLSDESTLSHNISVIPDIAEIEDNDIIIRNAVDLSAQSDDSEDTVDNPFSFHGGFPGYDSREYVPGDPLKRINWKQSVRRGRLYVRTDEEAACSGIAVVLDKTFLKGDIIPSFYAATDKFMGKADDEIIPLIAQYAVEYFLGVSVRLMQQGFSVSCYICDGGEWECYRITDENDIARLRTELASYAFDNNDSAERIPFDRMEGFRGSVSVFCTPYADKSLYERIGSGDGRMKTDMKTVLYAVAASSEINERKSGNEG